MSNPDEDKKDIFRNTWVRYLGYANEVGEAFRVQVHVNWVRLSYVVATGYVVADTVDKTYLEYKSEDRKVTRRVAFACADSLVWQGLASVIVPGFTINRVCWAAGLALGTRVSSPLTRRWLVTGIGLACIPFIIHPIDSGVHWALDHSLRRLAPVEAKKSSSH